MEKQYGHIRANEQAGILSKGILPELYTKEQDWKQNKQKKTPPHI